MHTPRARILGLIGFQLLGFTVAGLGGLASVNAVGFYGQLTQPSWAPPAAVFGPVWTTLFILMSLSAWLVWRQAGFRNARLALGMYITQLACNALWSWLFFVWKLGQMALLDVTVLWLLIAACMVQFGRVSKPAAALLLPYLAWVSFAWGLNLALWQMNSGLLGHG